MQHNLNCFNSRIPPLVADLFFAMTLCFPARQRSYWIFLMKKRYLTRKLFALRSKAIVAKKMARAINRADFEDFCYAGYFERPSKSELLFSSIQAQALWPIHLERAGEGKNFCNNYSNYLEEQTKPKLPRKVRQVQQSKCDWKLMPRMRILLLDLQMYHTRQIPVLERKEKNKLNEKFKFPPQKPLSPPKPVPPKRQRKKI